jgi:hypothetical protein
MDYQTYADTLQVCALRSEMAATPTNLRVVNESSWAPDPLPTALYFHQCMFCSCLETHRSYKQKPVLAVVQVIKGFSAKSDGKDKLTALVQVRWHGDT